MKRKIEKYLLEWKNKIGHYPLLMRGARQVGKSYIIESFGKNHFTNVVTINFELMPHFKEAFSNLNPQDIINKIELIAGLSIKKNETLLFLDEIQECPQAIQSLRYFKEQASEFMVIGAGSLLEFAFRNQDFRMPVGRVQFINLEPLSFEEFLDAAGNDRFHEYLSRVLPGENDKIIHDKLLELLRIYLSIGGMPAVVKEYISKGNLLECARMQTSLLETYRGDFGKYANLAQHKYLQKVFNAAPQLAGQRVKYVNIDREIKSRDLKNALDLLVLGRIVRPVYASAAAGVPLGAQIDMQKFKLNFVDVGLMQNACGLQAKIQIEKDIMQINAGAVAEQFVSQELRAYADPYTDNSLYFWARDRRGSMAEVDYLFVKDNCIFPLEVKSGKTGTLKSVRIFLQEKKANFGIRVSPDCLSFYDNILSLPFYMINQLPRLLDYVSARY